MPHMSESRKKSKSDVNELGPAADEKPARRTRKRASAGKTTADQSAQFVVEACRLMSDLHCTGVVAYDVRGRSDVTDYILIATGTSDRQMRSVADDLEKLGAPYDLQPFGKEIDGPTTWIVLDFIDAVVHLFEPQARAFYDLEMLWGDCPKIEWKR
jgi:ribosome-associated protein